MYENRNYAVFAVSELPSINFEEVLETSADTVRKSVDGTKTFVKWNGSNVPPSVAALNTIEDYYNHEEMLNLLNDPFWTPLIDRIESP